MAEPQLRAATRGSALARTQTDLVIAALDRDVATVIVETSGDRRTDLPLSAIGGKGVFVKEVQAAVLDGRADFAVHSGKDLPAITPEGLVIAAIPERSDPRDVLIGSTLDALRPGALVATGSIRRRAQLAWLRPDLTFADLRGNVDTRLAKAGDYDAIVLAMAGLVRLRRTAHATEILEPELVLPQVAQGALVIECRADDGVTRAALAAIDHQDTRTTVSAERAFLATLGGDCNLPAGAHATLCDKGVSVTAILASSAGHTVIRHRVEGSDPEAAGAEVANHLLDNAGGRALLTENTLSKG